MTAHEYESACFLCLRPFDSEVQKTLEDVVPKWLLKRQGLGNAVAKLPDGRLLQYGRRKIPCCRDCNQRMAAQLEQPVSDAFAFGFEAVADLNPTLLFVWLGKLFYGTRFKETGLRANVRNPESEPMLDPQGLTARNEYLRLCLLADPSSLTLIPQPGSLFLFRAGVPDDPAAQFDYFVSTFAEVDMVALRVADTFAICTFGDPAHWIQELGEIPIVRAARDGLTLHPWQCVEMYTWFASELAGYQTSGSFDLLTLGGLDGEPQRILTSRFRVEKNQASREAINTLFAKSFLHRLNLSAKTPASQIPIGQRPSLLVNPETNEPLQAECFDPRCASVFTLAGWQTNVPWCETCRNTTPGDDK